MIEEPEPERQLRLNARRLARRQGARGRVSSASIRDAAPVDEDIAALWGGIQSEFYEKQRAIVASLAGQARCAPGLDVAAATDLLWTLNHPDVWRLLVGERGWTAERYEQWLADAICVELLGVRG